jgi:thiamine-phosphate pyrophosphorylase
LLGVSVATVGKVTVAEAARAGYLGVTVWRTRTKPEAIATGAGGVAGGDCSIRLPVVGSGGIVAGNAEQLLRAGAAGVPVVSAVSQAVEPTVAVRRLAIIVRRCRTLVAADGG